jgi:hypothetical protein
MNNAQGVHDLSGWHWSQTRQRVRYLLRPLRVGGPARVPGKRLEPLLGVSMDAFIGYLERFAREKFGESFIASKKGRFQLAFREVPEGWPSTPAPPEAFHFFNLILVRRVPKQRPAQG